MIDIQSVGSVSIIRSPSSLQADSLAQCRQSVTECFAKRRSLIILDLSDSLLINSEGLEFIVDTQHECLARGGKLVVAGPQPLCAEILFITGVEDSVAVFHDMRSALSDFAK